MNRYSNLITTVKKFKPASILEVGTWNGINAVKMICEALNHHTKVKYFGFDLFEDFAGMEKEEHCPKTPAKISKVRDLLHKIPCCESVLICGNTKKTLANFVNPPKVDLIFIDGGHSIETIAADWKNCQRFAHKKTVFLLDDYYYDNKQAMKFGCNQLVDKVWQENAGKIEVKWLKPVDAVNGGIAMIRILQL